MILHCLVSPARRGRAQTQDDPWPPGGHASVKGLEACFRFRAISEDPSLNCCLQAESLIQLLQVNARFDSESSSPARYSRRRRTSPLAMVCLSQGSRGRRMAAMMATAITIVEANLSFFALSYPLRSLARFIYPIGPASLIWPACG